jgi:hypothetical protein
MIEIKDIEKIIWYSKILRLSNTMNELVVGW